MDTSRKLSQLISKLRTENGWSVEELATASGLSINDIQDLENPDTEVMVDDRLVAIAGGLGLKVSELVKMME